MQNLLRPDINTAQRTVEKHVNNRIDCNRSFVQLIIEKNVIAIRLTMKRAHCN